jgi:hypothetical protein
MVAHPLKVDHLPVFEFMTSLLTFGRHGAPAARTCPVCCAGIGDDDRYVAVRGMRIHGGCAGYRQRRLGTSSGVGRMAG